LKKGCLVLLEWQLYTNSKQKTRDYIVPSFLFTSSKTSPALPINTKSKSSSFLSLFIYTVFPWVSCGNFFTGDTTNLVPIIKTNSAFFISSIESYNSSLGKLSPKYTTVGLSLPPQTSQGILSQI